MGRRPLAPVGEGANMSGHIQPAPELGWGNIYYVVRDLPYMGCSCHTWHFGPASLHALPH